MDTVQNLVRNSGRYVVDSIPVEVGDSHHAAKAIAVSRTDEGVFAEVEGMVDFKVGSPFCGA